ncbi:MAG: thioredoxin domain-containing protein, partial [Alphaproteobacteria bacterium]|nr:thioredoxin domain-containing protein [Alphaproteobacteria bacterium]
ASLINSAELFERAVQIIIRGVRAAPDTAALLRAVHEVSLPNRILAIIPPGRTLPHGHPAAGKDMIGGGATAYICQGPVCSLPIADPASLAAELRARR